MVDSPRQRGSRRSLAIAATAGAVVLASTGIAFAQITATGPWTGCVNNATGALRVIDPSSGQSCVQSGRKAETQIEWNAVGPQGIQGIQGIQGEKGDTGEKGDAGSPGTFSTSTVTIARSAKTSTADAVATASCPTGSTATGGGFSVVEGLGYDFVVQTSIPVETGSPSRPTGWTVTATSATNIPIGFVAYAVCAS